MFFMIFFRKMSVEKFEFLGSKDSYISDQLVLKLEIQFPSVLGNLILGFINVY